MHSRQIGTRRSIVSAFTFAMCTIAIMPSTVHAQDVFVSSYFNATIDEFTPTGTFVRNLVPTIGTQPNSLRFGPNGDLYSANNNGTITEYNANTGALVGTLNTGANNCTDIAFDASGNEYIAVLNHNEVLKYSSTGTLLQTYTDHFSTPEGLDLLSNGNLLVTSSFGSTFPNTVTEINTTTGVGTTFATGLSEPIGIATGPDGRFYVPDYTDGGPPGNVDVIAATGGASSNFTSGGSLDGASYLAFEGSTLYVTSYYNNSVQMFDSTTGAFTGSFTEPSASGIAIRSVPASDTPEPGTLPLIGALVLSGGYLLRRRHRK